MYIKKEWFLRTNPDGRIPTVEQTPSADGKPQGKDICQPRALMLYLYELYLKDYKPSDLYDADEYWEFVEW